MYKVIIVDDESVVRQGLRRMIAWNDHGFELIGDYENGREAWEAVERDKPDLIISDISMPFMDGLELARLVSASYPYMKLIILTGYDQFEYAQQAIRLKVRDFVLKPITAREVRALLDKVRGEMDEEARRLEDLGRLRSQLHQSLPLLKERFLERLVMLGLGKPEIEERFAYFGLPKISPPYLVMVADIDDFGGREDLMNDGHDAEFLRFAVFNIFEEVLSAQPGTLLFRNREEKIMAVVGSAEDESGLFDVAVGMAEEVRHHVEKYLKFTVTIGIGRSCSSLEQLPDSCRTALAALDYRFLKGKNRVLSIVDLEGTQALSAVPFRHDWDRKLTAAIKTVSGEEALRLIDQSVADLRESRLPIETCLLHMQKIVLALMNIVQELGAEEGAEESDRDWQLWLTEIYRFKTLEEIGDWLKRIAASLIGDISCNRSHYTRMQIVKATEYIEEHYAEEKLSLQDLCRHVLMSTSHFSLVFKQMTGVTFIEYLTRVRIERAKELLLTTSLKFYEIASKVGYADPNYFSLLFKKHTGKTPREFRERPAREGVL